MPIGVLGAQLFMGSTPLSNVIDAADEISDFLALESVEVGSIEELGSFGPVFDEVGFEAVEDGRNFKDKGSFDPGTFSLTVAQDITDPGQALLRAYSESFRQDTYPFKLLFNGADPTVEAVYFGAKIMAYTTEAGAVDNVTKAVVELAIDTEIFFGVDEAAGLYNDGGVLNLVDDSAWPKDSSGAPGSFWSNGGVVSVVPGGAFALASPVFFGEISSDDLLDLGALGLATTQPATGTKQMWIISNEVWVA